MKPEPWRVVRAFAALVVLVTASLAPGALADHTAHVNGCETSPLLLQVHDRPERCANVDVHQDGVGASGGARFVPRSGANVTNGTDGDADGVPSTLTVRDADGAAIVDSQQVDPNDGDANDPVPTTRTERVPLPPTVSVPWLDARDDDQDCLPRAFHVVVQPRTLVVQFDRSGAGAPVTWSEEAGASENVTVRIDADDSAPDVPRQEPVDVQQTVTLVAGAPALDPDGDGDGVPARAAVPLMNVTVTLRVDASACPPTVGAPGVDVGATWTEHVPLDADDSDADAPVPREHRVPIGVPAPGVPTQGPDGDADGFPAHVTVPVTERSLVVWLNESEGVPVGHAITEEHVTDVTLPVDPNDENASIPLHPVITQTVIVPAPGVPTPGPDADGDGVPAWVSVPFSNRTFTVTFDRQAATPGGLVAFQSGEEPASAVVVQVDDAEDDPERPVPTNVTVRVPFGPAPAAVAPAIGGDEDGDGLPSAVTVLLVNRTLVVNVSRSPTHAPLTVRMLEDAPWAVTVTPDPSDGDANDPLPSRHEFREPLPSLPSAPVVGPDEDGDGVPAWVRVEQTERTLVVGVDRTRVDSPVTAAVEEGQVVLASVTLDEDDANASRPLAERVTASAPLPSTPAGLPVPGPDEDGDGVPATLEVPLVNRTLVVTVDRSGAGAVEHDVRDDSTWTIVLAADPDDSDDSVPAPSRFAISHEFLVPGLPEAGADADGDGFPSAVTVPLTRRTVGVTLDRTASGPGVANVDVTDATAPPHVVAVDEHDDDPARPVADEVRQEVPLGPVPTGPPVMGSDGDGDGAPAFVDVPLSNRTLVVTVDRLEEPAAVVTATVAEDSPNAWTERVVTDEDDADPDVPVPTIVSESVTLPALPGAPAVGADADGDGVPVDVRIVERPRTLVVSVDRRAPESARVDVVDGPESDVARIELDEDDSDASVPAESVLVVEQTVSIPREPVLGPDADGDDVPAFVRTSFTDRKFTVRVDRTRDAPEPLTVAIVDGSTSAVDVPVDEDDGNASRPAPQRVTATAPLPPVPAGAPEPGEDADGDGFPGSVTVRLVNRTATVTVDRSAGAAAPEIGVVEEPWAIVLAVDEDDDDKRRPVESVVQARVPLPATPAAPVVGPDEDADGVPAWVRVTETHRTLVVDVDRTRTADPVKLTVEAQDATVAEPALDPNDGDADDPVPRRFSAFVVIAEPGTPVVGPDADGDGAPAFVDVPLATRKVTVTVDRSSAGPSIVHVAEERRDQAPLRVEPDEDDTDPEVPAPSTVTQSLTIPLPGTPTAGPDADGDGVPSGITMPTVDVTVIVRVDRTMGAGAVTYEVTEAPGEAVAFGVDPDDADASTPVPYEDPDPVVLQLCSDANVHRAWSLLFDGDSCTFTVHARARDGTVTLVTPFGAFPVTVPPVA